MMVLKVMMEVVMLKDKVRKRIGMMKIGKIAQMSSIHHQDHQHHLRVCYKRIVFEITTLLEFISSIPAPPPTLNTSSPPLNIPTSSTNNNQRNVPSSSPVLKTPPLIYDELVSSNNMVDSNIPGEISLDQDLTKEETDDEDDGQGLGPLLDLVPTSRIKAKLSFANGSSSKPTTPSTMNTLKSTFSTSISSSSVSKTSNTGYRYMYINNKIELDIQKIWFYFTFICSIYCD